MWFGISILLKIQTVVLQVMTLSCLIGGSSILETCCVSIFRIEVYIVFYQGKQNIKCHLDVMLISVVYVQIAQLLTKKDWKGFQAWRLKTSGVWHHVVGYVAPDILKVCSVCLQSQAVHEDCKTQKIKVLKILQILGTTPSDTVSHPRWLEYTTTLFGERPVSQVSSTVTEFQVLLGDILHRCYFLLKQRIRIHALS